MIDGAFGNPPAWSAPRMAALHQLIDNFRQFKGSQPLPWSPLVHTLVGQRPAPQHPQSSGSDCPPPALGSPLSLAWSWGLLICCAWLWGSLCAGMQGWDRGSRTRACFPGAPSRIHSFLPSVLPLLGRHRPLGLAQMLVCFPSEECWDAQPGWTWGRPPEEETAQLSQAHYCPAHPKTSADEEQPH